jgi:DNA-binding NtrC family response regulator
MFVEVVMPNRTTETSERLSMRPPAPLGLSAIERACISRLIGHDLALVQREFILQTLRFSQGNRTHAANVLGISIRSLRDRIRNYREQGESVPKSESSCLEHAPGRRISDSRH